MAFFRQKLSKLLLATAVATTASTTIFPSIPPCYTNKKPIHFSSTNSLPKYSLFLKAQCASSTSMNSSPLNVKISKSINYDGYLNNDKNKKSFGNLSTQLHFTLFQFATCPFCCKVRAYLDYHGLSYDIVEVNSVTRSQLNSKWCGKSSKVPILIVHSKQKKANNDQNSNEIVEEYIILRDSSVIVSILESIRELYEESQEEEKSKNSMIKKKLKINDDNDDDDYNLSSWSGICRTMIEINSFYPKQINANGKEEYKNRYQLMLNKPLTSMKDYQIRKEEAQWRKWVDEEFVHVISPNLYRTMQESLESFKQFSILGDWETHFPNWERNLVIYLGSFVMYFVGKRLKRRHQLNNDVRESLYEMADKWTFEIARKDIGPFMGGITPNLADLAFYGCLTSMITCQAGNDLMKQRPKLKLWFQKMQQQFPSSINENKKDNLNN